MERETADRRPLRRLAPFGWMALAVGLGALAALLLTEPPAARPPVPAPAARGSGPTPPAPAARPSAGPGTVPEPRSGSGGPPAAGASVAVTALRDALEGSGPREWIPLVEGVMRPGLEAAVPALLEVAAREPGEPVLLAVLRALEVIGGRQGIRGLAELGRRHPSLGDQAAVRLSRCSAREAVAELLEILEEEKEAGELAAAAVRALGRSGVREPLPRLMAAARSSPDPGVRREAVEALGRIADPPALEVLEAAGREDDPRIRRSAIRALGRIRSPRAVAILEAFLAEDPGALERELIRDALAAQAGLQRSPW